MAELVTLPPAARFSLRGDPDELEAGCAAFGVARPDALRTATADGRAALWLGPDEILLIGPPGTPPPDAGWPVDVSGRNIALSLTGTDAAEQLAAGCPLDLERFGVGHCTRTLLGKADIVLWRTGADAWRVEVWRSFAAYVTLLLQQAARDWP